MDKEGFLIVLFAAQCLCDAVVIFDKNKFEEWNKKDGMSSKGLGLRYNDPVSDRPEYQRISNSFDFVKQVNGVPVSVTYFNIQDKRIRDVYTNAMMLYYQNLLEFHDKIHQPNIWQPQPELKFSSDPYKLLNKNCSDKFTSEDILTGYLTPRDLLNKTDDELKEACLERGSIPVLQCSEYPGRNFKCICNSITYRARWGPYSFRQYPETGFADPNIPIVKCIPYNGRVCSNAVNVKCNETTECIDGVCSGKLASLTVNIGGAAVYLDEEVREIMQKFDFMTIEEAIEYLFLRSNAKGILKTQCNEDLWKYATEFPQLMIKEFNNTDKYKNTFKKREFKYAHDTRNYYFSEYTSCSTYSEMIEDIYFLPPTSFPTSLPKDEHLKLYKLKADYYDDTVRCLDEYPRMICKSEQDNRGRCNCMTSKDSGSPYFNFVEEDGFCVGELNSVCTTVRGSTKYQCKKGLECIDVLQKQNPIVYLQALTSTVIKWCQNPNDVTEPPKQKPKPNFSSRIEKDISIQLLYTIIIIYIL